MAQATKAVEAEATAAKTEYHNIRLALFKNTKKTLPNQPDFILKRKLEEDEAKNSKYKWEILGAAWIKPSAQGDFFTVNIDSDKMKAHLA